MLDVRCDWCRNRLDQPGGLLFAPPSPDGTCEKLHLCTGCHRTVRATQSGARLDPCLDCNDSRERPCKTCGRLYFHTLCRSYTTSGGCIYCAHLAQAAVVCKACRDDFSKPCVFCGRVYQHSICGAYAGPRGCSQCASVVASRP